MATNFDRWEKDPFFPAAEEVQESADSLSDMATFGEGLDSMWDSEQLRRDLQTTLGTAKWQLEEFSRAVKSSDKEDQDEDSKRHRDFINAIGGQIGVVDKSLVEASAVEGKSPRPWVQLDEREMNELVLFLSAGPHMSRAQDNKLNMQQNDHELESDNTRDFGYSGEHCELPPKGTRTNGHRRTASASAEMEAWKISVEDDACPISSNNCRPDPPRRIPSVLGLLSTMNMESTSKFDWLINGYRKLKVTDSQESGLPPLPKFHGWCGAAQRLLQRSHYQMKTFKLCFGLLFFA